MPFREDLFRTDLMCQVHSLFYNFDTKTGTLKMPEGSCCDMKGCIALFKKIDENVKHIETLSGNVLDTEYVLSGDNWHCVD